MIGTETRLLHEIDHIDFLSDSQFRDLELDIVRHYRQNEEDQELIAVTLIRKLLSEPGNRTQDRVNEILAMLAHVHDPLIT